MTYERAFIAQADLRIVRGSTNERKHMSTKTTFKRIALVTVAALGFGMVASVSPASAAPFGVATNSLVITSSVAAATAATPATGAADIVADLKVAIATTAMASGDTLTVTYTVKNPAATDITSLVTIVDSPTAATGVTGTLTLGANKKSITIADTATVATHTIGKLTIPASALVTGGTYKVTTVTTVGNGGTPVEMDQSIYVAGVQVTQGTTKSVAAGAAVTGNSARVKVFFPTTAANDVYKIVPSGVGSIVNRYAIAGTSAATATVAPSDYSQGLTFTAGGTDQASVELTLGSAVAGDQVLTVLAVDNATGVATAKYKATVTWGAAPAYVDSTAFLSTTTGSSATADTLAVDRKSSAVYGASAIARISVKQYTDAAKTIQTAGTAKAVVVTITGAGAVDTVASNGATRGSQATVAASATASTDSEFYVYSDGRAGAATIAITVNGVAVKSYTWNFFGTATSLKEDADTSPEKSYIGVGETGTLTVFSYDANSVLVSDAPSVNATSDTATVATVSTTGTGSVTVTGVKAGKTNINICVGSCATSTVKIVIPVEITAVSAASAGVTMAFDKATYEPGEKMVLTVSAVDANGRPVADGARSLFSAAITANVSFGGASVALPGTSVALAGGVKTYTLYAPSASGAVTVTGKEGAAVALTEKAAGTAAGVAYVAKTITASAVVNNSAVDAATDAANEAVDAANAATDAALAAAEAADAATTAAQEASDAVAALSESVTKLIAGLQAQIKSLAAVVAKIAKKVKA